MTNWLRLHLEALSAAWRQMQQHLVTTLTVWLVVALTLIIPVLAFLGYTNLTGLVDHWRGTPTLSVFLQPGLSPAEVDTAVSALAAMDGLLVQEVIAPEQALRELQVQLAASESLTLDPDWLPAVVVLSEQHHDAARVQRIAQMDLVDQVIEDRRWLERLAAILALMEQVMLVFTLLFGGAITLASANTIRMVVQSRHDHIEVMRLVGSSDRFIRLPFCYLGLFYGVGGAVVCLALIAGGLIFLEPALERLALLYDGSFQPRGFGLELFGLVFLVSGVLCTAGASAAVRRHLRSLP